MSEKLYMSERLYQELSAINKSFSQAATGVTELRILAARAGYLKKSKGEVYRLTKAGSVALMVAEAELANEGDSFPLQVNDTAAVVSPEGYVTAEFGVLVGNPAWNTWHLRNQDNEVIQVENENLAFISRLAPAEPENDAIWQLLKGSRVWVKNAPELGVFTILAIKPDLMCILKGADKLYPLAELELVREYAYTKSRRRGAVEESYPRLPSLLRLERHEDYPQGLAVFSEPLNEVTADFYNLHLVYPRTLTAQAIEEHNSRAIEADKPELFIWYDDDEEGITGETVAQTLERAHNIIDQVERLIAGYEAQGVAVVIAGGGGVFLNRLRTILKTI